MSKADYFAKNKAGKLVPVEKIEGLPELFARQLSHGEYSSCLETYVQPSGKKDFRVNYAAASLLSIVVKSGQPFFNEDDRADLQAMSAEGMQPFIAAFNKANGLVKDEEEPEGKSSAPEAAPSGDSPAQ